MWSTSLPITRGWFTDIPSRRGRDGTRIPESGLAARIFHSDSASGLAGSEVLDRDGVIGDSTGITTMRSLTTAGTFPRAERFITGAISTAAERDAAQSRAAELMARAGGSTTVPVLRPGLSMETGRRLEVMLNLAVKAACARALSVATTMADRPRAIRRAEAPASVGQQRLTAEGHVAADLGAAAGAI